MRKQITVEPVVANGAIGQKALLMSELLMNC